MNAASPPWAKKKYYTLAEANATLPLLRSILRDVTTLAGELRDRFERLHRLQNAKGGLDSAHQEEVQQLIEEFERGQEKMTEYEHELEKLNVELKDHHTGLIDFRHLKDGKEIYLCWRLGEAVVAHWHDLDAGVAGRQQLTQQIHNG
ncbi:MAG: DUF2203 family protein [Gemmataceae bacterium]|nr:DUF2203 family protein [Gemmataceae bacterium]